MLWETRFRFPYKTVKSKKNFMYSRRSFHHIVGNAVDFSDFGRNGLLGINKGIKFLGSFPINKSNGRELDNTVFTC